MSESEVLWREVDAYFVETLVNEDDALVAAREAGPLTTMPRAEVSPPQGKLLALLVKMTGAARFWSSARWPGTAPSGWRAPWGNKGT